MKSKLEFFSEFDHRDPVISFEGSESLARQEFKDESNINNIIKRYQATGLLVDPLRVDHDRRPMFGDFSSVPDYQHAMQIIFDAQEQFEALPVEIRQRFNYDPVNLLEFLGDPANRPEAERLGLIQAKPIIEAPQKSGKNPPDAAEAAKGAKAPVANQPPDLMPMDE